jgi:hypothetical protein
MQWKNVLTGPAAVLLAAPLVTGCQDSVPTEPLEPQALAVAAAVKPAPSLRSTIEYVFVGNLGMFDGEGRLLVWDGEIHGDIEGEIQWWFVLGGGPPNMPDQAHVMFYEARWEIWDGTDLLLAGNSAGKTATPPGKDGIWRGRGIVTEAYAGFEDWSGRRVSEGGNVNWDFPWSGEGTFRIN